MIGVAAVALGLTLGWVCGGSSQALKSVRLHCEVPVILLFVVQAIARGRVTGTGAMDFGVAVWVAACIALCFCLASSRREPGIWIAAVGLVLNVLVVLLNGGMPIAVPGGVDSGSLATAIRRSMGFYQIAGPSTIGAGLGDSMLFRFSTTKLLLSPGDVILAIGVVVFVSAAMRTTDNLSR